MIGGVAHGSIAGLLALLSLPERGSGAFLLMSEPLSGALAALRGFRRRWAEPELGPEVALGTPSVHSVTPDSRGSFSLVDHETPATTLLSAFEQVSVGVSPSVVLGQSIITRPPVHGREWAPHRVDGSLPRPVEPSFRPTLGYRPLAGPFLCFQVLAISQGGAPSAAPSLPGHCFLQLGPTLSHCSAYCGVATFL